MCSHRISGTLRILLLAVAVGLACFGPTARAVIIWNDEFNQPDGSGPDPSRWVYDLGDGGWGNNELQTYTASRDNSFVLGDSAALNGKVLEIQALRAPNDSYTSARIKTLGRFSITHGRLEARMKLSTGRGLWPAFWALGTNIETVGWPACGEIDVVEQVGHKPREILGSLHSPGFETNSRVTVPANVSLVYDYHVYSVVWSPNRLEWFLDGVSYGVRTIADLPPGGEWVFEKPFFLILNLAVGGALPGNPTENTNFPQSLYIDYVRVHSTAPDPPLYLGAVSDLPGRIVLSWTRPPVPNLPIAGHRLVRAENDSFTLGYIERESGPEPYLIEDALEPGKGYFYRVATVADGETSTFSSPAFAQVAGSEANQPGSGNVINSSTRAVVGAGDTAIAGFVVGGGAPRRVLVRAIGPSLLDYGVTDALPDPVLTLRDATQAILASNDNWSDGPEGDAIVQASSEVGAFALATGSKDAAILLLLPPGAYTAVVEGRSGQKGIALLEMYEVP